MPAQPPLSLQFSGKYMHYKDIPVTVIGVALHSETMEEMVLYREDEDGALWVRPLAMFMEEVVVNGIKMPRFRKMEP